MRLYTLSLAAVVVAVGVTLWPSLLLDAMTPHDAKVNLTGWRQHRRQKRFILFEHAGICKLVCGIAFPVNLGDKITWRQLVMTMNLQYQFPVPPRPIYWWERWQDRAMPASAAAAAANKQTHAGSAAKVLPSADEAQLFLYQFAEQFLQRRQLNGLACLQRLICENAQIHRHQGLLAELLHRVLIPHHALHADYVDAYKMGRHGVNCRQAFPQATHCLLDPYLHVREEYLAQTFLK